MLGQCKTLLNDFGFVVTGEHAYKRGNYLTYSGCQLAKGTLRKASNHMFLGGSGKNSNFGIEASSRTSYLSPGTLYANFETEEKSCNGKRQ